MSVGRLKLKNSIRAYKSIIVLFFILRGYLMRGKTRSQRIKDYRKARFERAVRVIEGKNFHRNKMSRGIKLYYS